MHRKNEKYFIVAIILILSVGFAYLTASLSINGGASVKGNTWNVYLNNINVLTSSGSIAADSIGINNEKDTVSYSINLLEPGDYFEFTVDAVNGGTLDAMIDTISNQVFSGETAISLPNFAEYSVTYADGTEVQQKDILKAGKKDTFKVRVTYKDGQLQATDQDFSFKFSVNYKKNDGTGKERKKIVCKRATTLYTEECKNTGTVSNCAGAGYYEGGSKGTTTITYGNIGTGSTLSSGDAFDCNVDGSGFTERFYYVSDLYTGTVEEVEQYDTSTAVLIYYGNVLAGNRDDGLGVDYTSESSTWIKGPDIAYRELPDTTKWTNIELVNQKRNIEDNNGKVIIENFEYTGKAARLLTKQEAVKACGGTGTASEITTPYYLHNCEYLLENTQFAEFSSGKTAGFWLENPHFYTNTYAWATLAGDDIIYVGIGTDERGVRPAIEVPKTQLILE